MSAGGQFSLERSVEIEEERGVEDLDDERGKGTEDSISWRLEKKSTHAKNGPPITI